MIQNDLYRKYLKHQAEAHPDLAHQDAAGDRVFEMVSIEEALGDFRSGAKEKAMILRGIWYTYSVIEQGSQTYKALSGGWIVAKYFNPRGSRDDFFDAMEAAEKVNDELVEKMISDSRNGHPLFLHSLDSQPSVNVQPVVFTGDASYAGYRTIVSWTNFFRVCLTDEAAPAWADGGVTPNEL